MKLIYTFAFVFCMAAMLFAPDASAQLVHTQDWEQAKAKEYERLENFSVVQPNPARLNTLLRFHNPYQLQYEVEIYNIIGNRVKTFRDVETDEVEIDLSDFVNGVYFYFVIRNNERVSAGRIVKRS